MHRTRRLAIGSTGLLAVLLLLVVTVLPQIVRSKGIAAVVAATGRPTSIGAVSINPFTLTMTVDDFAIEEKGTSPLLAIGRLRVSVSAASLYRRALVLDEITVERARASFARTAPNRYSFSDIIDRQPASEKKGKFLFSLNNIVIRNGSIDFHDSAGGSERLHTVRSLEVGIPFISNIPYYAESFVAPRVTAVVNGTPFSLRGTTKPLSKSQQTSLHLGAQRLSLPEYVAYSPVRPPVAITRGFLSFDADVSYRVSSDKKPELALSGVVTLEGTGLSLRNGQPLVKLPLLQVKATRLDLTGKRYSISSIAADGLELFLTRDKRGRWMYQDLLPAVSTEERDDEGEEPEGEGAENEKAATVEVSSFTFRNGTVHVSDLKAPDGFRAEISGAEATVRGFSTTEGSPADYNLAFSMDGRSRVQSAGSFSFPSSALSGKVAVTGVELGRTWPYVSPYLTAPVEGRLDLSAAVSYSPEDGIAAEDVALSVRNLSARYGSGDALRIAQIQAAGKYRQQTNRLEISAINLSRGSVALSREGDGSLSVLSLLRQGGGEGAGSRNVPRPAEAETEPRPPLSYRIARVQCSGMKFAFTDKTKEEAPVFTLDNSRVTLTNLTGSHLNPAGVTLSCTFGKDAPISASGVMVPYPFSYAGTIKAARLPLRDFEAYLPDSLNLSVLGGVVDADLTVAVSVKDGRPEGSFRGRAGVRDFYSIDSVAEQDLLKWESLQLDGIRGEIAPFALDIRQIALNNLYSRIIVRPDGTLNVQNLVEKDDTAGAEGAKATGPAAAAGTAASAKPAEASLATETRPNATPAGAAVPSARRISIGSVTIQEGTVAFSDFHLPQPFSTTFYHLGGRVSGLSSDDAKFAEVDLRGNLENRSPLQITGRINPLREDLLVDLKITFRDIELPGVSPYSGTYLGYRVDQGKLYLDLKYLIEKKQLDSQNKVFIDRFTFGEKVESPKATKMPVHLVVALLKDRNGEIHLDLPVTGRTDDPQFSVWGVVWQVVKNVVAKAATSPMALLSSMFGGGSDLSSVNFDPGAAAVSRTEAEKLRKLSQALADRPGIKLEVCGFVDREKDPEGYRLELLKKKMQGEKLLQLAKEKRLKPGETADTLEIEPEERSKLLKAVYEKEKFPKPRTVVGTLKSLPDAEMTKLILAHTAVGEDQLRALAHQRCAVVTAFLVGEGKVPQERVYEKLGDIHGGARKEGSSGARVEFGIVAK